MCPPPAATAGTFPPRGCALFAKPELPRSQLSGPGVCGARRALAREGPPRGPRVSVSGVGLGCRSRAALVAPRPSPRRDSVGEVRAGPGPAAHTPHPAPRGAQTAVTAPARRGPGCGAGALRERPRSPGTRFQPPGAALAAGALCPSGGVGSWPALPVTLVRSSARSPAARCVRPRGWGQASRLGTPSSPARSGVCIVQAFPGSASTGSWDSAQPGGSPAADASPGSRRGWVCGRSRRASAPTCSDAGPLGHTWAPGPGRGVWCAEPRGRRGRAGDATGFCSGFVAGVVRHYLPRPALPLYEVNKQYRSTRAITCNLIAFALGAWDRGREVRASEGGLRAPR